LLAVVVVVAQAAATIMQLLAVAQADLLQVIFRQFLIEHIK
jgi:hypothetical protein